MGISLLVAGGGRVRWPSGAADCPPRPAPRPTASGSASRVLGPISAEWTVYLGTVLAIAVFVLAGLGILLRSRRDDRPMTIIPSRSSSHMRGEHERGSVQVLAVVVQESSRPAGLVLVVAGLLAFGYIGVETFRLDTRRPPADVRGPDPHLLLHALLGVLRAGRQLA